MKRLKVLVILALCLIALNSCKNSKTIETEKVEKNAEIKVVIDSTSFKLEKNKVKDFSVVKDEAPSSKEEVEKLVASEDISNLNEYQKFAQEFINACAKKDYASASKYLAYNGAESSRINKESFNYTKPAEKNVVKITSDVVFKFLAESSDYKFISSKEKMDKGQTFQELEITFFKKGIGVNRRFFDIIDTPKGMLIYNMR